MAVICLGFSCLSGNTHWAMVRMSVSDLGHVDVPSMFLNQRAIKAAYANCESGRPKQWAVTSLVSGGCDSSRLSLSVPIWPADAATAAGLKGESGGAEPSQEKTSFRAKPRVPEAWKLL